MFDIHEIINSEQLQQTLKSLQRISPIDQQSQQFKSSLNEYSQSHLLLFKQIKPNQQQKWFCFLKEQFVNDHYVDSILNKVYAVDVMHSVVLQEKQSQIQTNKEISQLGIKIRQKLINYVNKFYTKNTALAVNFTIQNESITQIQIGISAKNTNFGHFFSGQWSSIWKFTQKQYSATFAVNNHFFETGNITFQRHRQILTDYPNKAIQNFKQQGQSFLDLMIRTIQDQEFKFQSNLNKSYSTSLSKGLKKLRRITPITQSKMNWNLNTVLLSQGLKQLRIHDYQN